MIQRRLLWTLLAGLLLPLPVLAGVETESNTSQLLALWLEGAPLAPLLFLIAYVVAQQLFISSTAFCIVGGVLFGPVYGTVINMAGASLGASVSFLTSRHLLTSWITPRLSPAMQRIREEVEHEGWRAVVMIRLLPVFPYAPVNYTLGLTRLPFLQFLLPTTLLIAPRVAIYTYIGFAGRQAMEGSLGLLWNIFIALGILVVLTWLPYRLRQHWKGRIRG